MPHYFLQNILTIIQMYYLQTSGEGSEFFFLDVIIYFNFKSFIAIYEIYYNNPSVITTTTPSNRSNKLVSNTNI